MVWRKAKIGGTFRDLTIFMQYFRELLLGRRHKLHNRFAPYCSPRTYPTADIPRGPEYKLSSQYYCNRHYMDSIAPPVVAPIAEGPPLGHPKTSLPVAGGLKPDTLKFKSLPTPGLPYWWDGHFYYECAQHLVKSDPYSGSK